jgi:hypothetical protein
MSRSFKVKHQWLRDALEDKKLSNVTWPIYGASTRRKSAGTSTTANRS